MLHLISGVRAGYKIACRRNIIRRHDRGLVGPADEVVASLGGSRLCSDVLAEAVIRLLIVGVRVHGTSDRIRYSIAVAVVVDINHRAAVARDVLLLEALSRKARNGLRSSRRERIRRATQRFAEHGRVGIVRIVQNVLEVVPHRVFGVAVGRERTGNGHVFGRHCEVIPAPAAERIARGRGGLCHRYRRAVFHGRLFRQRACTRGHRARIGIGHVIAVARVVQLQHQAAVARDIAAGNCALRCSVECKACIGFRVCRSSGIGLTRQVFGLRKGIAVILKVLLIVLHLIRSFAVGREGTGNGHVFGRHREAVFPAPAAERVARGRGVRCHCNSSAVFLGRLRRQLARARGHLARVLVGDLIAVARVVQLQHQAAVARNIAFGDSSVHRAVVGKARVVLRRCRHMRIRSGVLFFRLKQDESVSRQILLVVLHLVAGVRIGCKASRELYGAGRHRKARDLGIVFLPAVESITRGCGLIRHPDLGAVLVGNSSRQLACARGGSAVIIAYFIAVARVVNFQNQLSVACDHACENVVFIALVEPEALIALCLRRRRCIRDARQVRFCFAQSIALAVQILRPVLHRVPGIGIRGKGTRELHRAGGHFEACRYLAVLEPAVKRVARGRGLRSHRYIRTIFVGRGGRKRTCACGHCARVSIAHFIAVARVVQLQHQAAVARDIAAGNRALHGLVKCKACISLRVCRRSGIGLAFQVFGIRLHKVVTVARQVLLIMLHCISGIAVGRERTGNGHVFGGHREVLFLAPAAERVARGRGRLRHRHRRTVFHSRLFRQRARACGCLAHISIGHFIAVAVVFDLNHRAAVRGDGLLLNRLRRKARIGICRSVCSRPGRAVQGLPGRRIFSITVTCHILQHVLDGIRRVRSGAVNDLHGHTVLRHCACYRCNAGRITRNQRAGNAVRRTERDIPGYRLRRLLAPQCCVGHVIGIFVGDIQRIAVHRVVENDFVGCIVRTDRDGHGAVSRRSITRDCGRRFRHRLVKLRGHVFFRRRAGYRRLCAFQIIVNAVRLVVGRVIHVDHRRAVFRNIRGKRSPGCNAGVPGFVYDVRRHQASGLGRARNSFRQRSIAAVIVVDRIHRIRDFLIIERDLAVFAGGRLNIAGTLGQLITADRRGIYQQAVDRQVAADNILGNLFRGALNIMMHRGRPVLQLVIDEHYFLPVIQNFDVLTVLPRLITVNDRRIYSDGRAHFHFGAIDAFELIALRVLRHDDIGAAVRARPFRMERQVADDLLRGHERNGVRLVRIPAREHVALTGGVCGHLVFNRVVFRHADGRRSLRIRAMRVEGNRIIRLRPLGVDLKVVGGHGSVPVHFGLISGVKIPAHEHIVAVHTGRAAHTGTGCGLCAGERSLEFQRFRRNPRAVFKYDVITVAGILQIVSSFFPAAVQSLKPTRFCRPPPIGRAPFGKGKAFNGHLILFAQIVIALL